MSKSKQRDSTVIHKFSWIWVLFFGLAGGAAGAISSCAEWLKLDHNNEPILLSLAGAIAGVAGLLGTFIGIAYTFAVGSRDEGTRAYRNAVGKKLNTTFISMILGSFGSVFIVIASLVFLMFDLKAVTMSLVGMAVGALCGLAVQTILLLRVMSELTRRSDMRESQQESEQSFEDISRRLGRTGEG